MLPVLYYNYGPNTLLAKVDIKNSFQLIPVHPGDRHLLAMQWKNQIYIDTAVCLLDCTQNQNYSTKWLTCSPGLELRKEYNCILHNLDDFLIVTPPHSPLCQHSPEKLTRLCDTLGIQMASEKVEGPTSFLSIFRITLDTHRMEIHLPQDKLTRIQEMLSCWLNKKKTSKRKILSLVGLLQHAMKVVRCGHTFASRMYATAANSRSNITLPG